MSFWGTVMVSENSGPYGKRLVPAMVDEIAAKNPDQVFFSIPRSSDLSSGFHDVTAKTFANAVNKTAHFIEKEIGRSSMFETVMYIGHPDMRHYIALVALMKTGHKMLLSSHRNSVAGHANLIKRTDCGILLHTAGFPTSGILEVHRMESLCMPDLDYLLDDSVSCPEYPFTKTFDQAKHLPCMVIHTSGSTGMPKPVVWTHWHFTTSDTQNHVPDMDGRPSIWGGVTSTARRVYPGIPVFHGAGIVTGIVEIIYTGSTMVLGLPGLPTPDDLVQMIEYGRIDSAVCFPLTLEEVATRSDVLGQLHRLKHITFTGGSLSKRAGDIISQHAPLYNVMASMECARIIQHKTDREDWQYICFNEECNGIEWRPKGDLYELVFIRKEEYADIQAVFKTFPRLQEYPTSDLYSKHPTKPHHWKYEGRTDDMIVLRNGWNFNPMQHEMLINSHRMVQHCMLVGTGKDVPAAIVELHPHLVAEPEATRLAMIAEIWPKVEEANSVADTTGQLGRDYIIFAKKEKPFAIGGKGTVQRKATLARYSQEIEELYTGLGKQGTRL